VATEGPSIHAGIVLVVVVESTVTWLKSGMSGSVLQAPSSKTKRGPGHDWVHSANSNKATP
jgi:hypothetical protein